MQIAVVRFKEDDGNSGYWLNFVAKVRKLLKIRGKRVECCWVDGGGRAFVVWFWRFWQFNYKSVIQSPSVYSYCCHLVIQPSSVLSSNHNPCGNPITIHPVIQWLSSYHPSCHPTVIHFVIKSSTILSLYTGCSLNIVFFPRIFESLPPLPRQHHSAVIGCTKNYQPIGVTIHSHCVESF